MWRVTSQSYLSNRKEIVKDGFKTKEEAELWIIQMENLRGRSETTISLSVEEYKDVKRKN